MLLSLLTDQVKRSIYILIMVIWKKESIRNW